MTGPGGTVAWGDAPVSVVHAPTAGLDGSEGTTRWTALGGTGAGEVGIWEVDPGTVHDVETDEVFVVLSGRSTIRVEGWSDVEVVPGDVVRLRRGRRPRGSSTSGSARST